MRAIEFENLDEGKLANFAIGTAAMMGAGAATAGEITGKAMSSDMQMAIDKAVMQAKYDASRQLGNGHIDYRVVKQDVKSNGSKFLATVTISVPKLLPK
jgi:hypothetical protein